MYMCLYSGIRLRDYYHRYSVDTHKRNNIIGPLKLTLERRNFNHNSERYPETHLLTTDTCPAKNLLNVSDPTYRIPTVPSETLEQPAISSEPDAICDRRQKNNIPKNICERKEYQSPWSYNRSQSAHRTPRHDTFYIYIVRCRKNILLLSTCTPSDLTKSMFLVQCNLQVYKCRTEYK